MSPRPDFTDQAGINSKAAPSENSDRMLKLTPVDLKQEARQHAGLPLPWPTGCSHMQDAMKSPSKQHVLFLRCCTEASPMIEPLCNHSVRLIIYAVYKDLHTIWVCSNLNGTLAIIYFSFDMPMISERVWWAPWSLVLDISLVREKQVSRSLQNTWLFGNFFT